MARKETAYQPEEKKAYQGFLISITFAVLLCFLGISLGVMVRYNTLIENEMLARARAHFNNIVITRKWNSEYGGVFVEKKGNVESNPYLENPDIRTVDGKIYTKKNPAFMTKEISAIAKKEGLFTFHITSLRLINPKNEPDAFERKALESFEKGEKEINTIQEMDGQLMYRYIAPLYIENSCLQCHSKQGYKAGDVRGGISVDFNINKIKSDIRLNTFIIVIFTVSISGILLGVIFGFFNDLRKKLGQANEQLRLSAITDTLTGILNRRHLMARFDQEFTKSKRGSLNLSCAMIDVDHFKSVNDSYGHLAGDRILTALTDIVKGEIRIYDIFGRYGGEEFLLILPNTIPGTETAIAERIRANIEKNCAADIGMPGPAKVTVSIGVTIIRSDDATINSMINRADEAMYSAKKSGRNRVVLL